MNDAKLILQVDADITQYEGNLKKVEARIKSLTEALKTATGAEIAPINFKLQGLQDTKKQLQEFGKFGENTIGSLLQRLGQLKSQKNLLDPSNEQQLSRINQEIDSINSKLATTESFGREAKVKIIDQPVINSLEYFNKLLKEAKSKRDKISVLDPNTNIELQQANQRIEELQNKVKSIKSVGIKAEVVEGNTISGLEQKLSRLRNQKINVDVTNEGEIARLNDEIEQTTLQIRKLNDLRIDPGGKIVNDSARARQSLTNLGLVIQDLPFGFIAIQNNIPNLIQGFASLSQEAKSTGTSIGSLLKNQLQGGAGALLGIGLAVSTLTAGVTFLIQKYGSLGNAIDSFLGKSLQFQDKVKSLTDSFNDFNKTIKDNSEVVRNSQAQNAGQLVVIEQLAKGATDLTKSENERAKYLLRLKSLDEKYFAQLKTGVGDVDKIRQATDEYTKSLQAQAKVTGLANEYSAVTQQLEQQVTLSQKLELQRQQAAKRVSETFQIKGGANVFDLIDAKRAKDNLNQVSEAIKQNAEDTKLLTNRRKELGDEINIGVDALSEFNKGLEKTDTTKKIKFEFDLPKTEEFLQFEKFFDFGNSLKRLDDYADTLLDVTAKETERKNILKALQIEQVKVLGQNASFFTGLKLGVSTYEELKQAVINYGIALQNAILTQQKTPKIEAPTGLFKLLEPLNKLATDKRIPSLVDTAFPQSDFDNLKERAKGLTTDVVPEFDKLKQELSNLLILKQSSSGVALYFDEIKAIVDAKVIELNNAISKQKLTDFLSGPAAEAQSKRAKEFFDRVKKNAEDFQKNAQGLLERPFRQFFDTIIDEGKISFESFFDLFKDLTKRIAAQLIASGISKLITTILFPTGAAVSGAGVGTGFAKFIKTFFSAGGLLRGGTNGAVNNVNFGGVTSQGMQLKGEVVFVQRGSDLIGAINRTNATINRVG